MRKGMRILGTTAFVPLLAGCFEVGPIFGPESFTPTSGCYFCVAYDLMTERGTFTMLKGDTLLVRVFSTMGHDRGTFAVNGTALRLVRGDQLSTETSEPATTARVVAMTSGRDTVRSQAADTAVTARLALRVVDSASVTAIQTGLEPNPKLRVGDVRQLEVFLYAGQEAIHGGPTSMSVSNAAVLTAEPAQVNPKGIFLRAKAPGAATLTIRFLERTRSYDIEVIP